MFKGKLKKIIIISGFIAVVGFGSYYALTPKEKQAEYLTAKTTIGTIEDTILATGIIYPSERVQVGSQATGQIKKIHVKLNQKVKAGDLLVEIRSDTQKDALKDAEYTLANYEAQLQSRQVSLEKAEIRYKRQQAMLSSDATSQADVDDSRIAWEQAKADITEIKTKIKQAQNALNTAQTNLDYTIIRSPINGVVVSIPVSEGQTINAYQSTPTVVQIAQVDTVTIKPEIAEADIIKVKIGMPLYFNILGDTDKVYHSTLKSIDIGPTTLSDQGQSVITTRSNSGVYYYGSFDYPNTDKDLRMSMSAQVSIVTAKAENVVVVPAEAISTNKKGEKIVSVVKNGIKEDKVVKTGLTNNIITEIKEGLSENEEVIISSEKAEIPSRPPRQIR